MERTNGSVKAVQKILMSKFVQTAPLKESVVSTSVEKRQQELALQRMDSKERLCSATKMNIFYLEEDGDAPTYGSLTQMRTERYYNN